MSSVWNSLPIRSKLLLSIGAILAIFALALSIDYIYLSRQAVTLETTVRSTGEMLKAVGQARREAAYESVQSLAYFTAPNAKSALGNIESYKEAEANMDADLAKMKQYASSEEQSLVDSYAAWYPSFNQAKLNAFTMGEANNPKGGLVEMRRVRSSDGDGMLIKINRIVSARFDKANEDAVAGIHLAQTITVVSAVLSIGLGLLVAIFLGQSISRRLQDVTNAMGEVVKDEVGALVASMKRLASGDLTAKIATHSSPLPVRGSDEPAQLANAYNQLLSGVQSVGVEFTNTTELLSDLMMQIRSAAEQVSAASREIAEGNTNLSQRTEQQASGLEETASSMEEFTATVKQNSDSAQEANSLGAAAQTNARKGGESMNEVVATMNNINASSQKIVEIISVIDGIAFQTNILALNAAVEAARAGEQGRGFAVVAGEVRSLAQRSAAAAKEIKELIDDTVAKVTTGSGQVEAAGSTMSELVTSVQRVTDIVSDIAAASREQSSGIDQVNKAIAQMDEVTQQNSALVEEAAAAAGALEEQAKTLLTTVSTFKVEAAPGQSAPVRAAAPAPKAAPAAHAPAPKKRPAPAKSITARHKAVAAAPVHANGHSNGHAAGDGDWETF